MSNILKFTMHDLHHLIQILVSLVTVLITWLVILITWLVVLITWLVILITWLVVLITWLVILITWPVILITWLVVLITWLVVPIWILTILSTACTYKTSPLAPICTFMWVWLDTWYRIAGKFGGDFNLAVWRIVRTSPNLNSRQI